MELGRSSAAGRVRVPDRFTVRVSVADQERLERLPALPVELASAALEWARHRGYVVAARPRVAIVTDAGLRRGDIEVEARYSDTRSGFEIDEPADLGRTRAYIAPVVRSPRATLAILGPDGRESTIVADGGPLSIGRSAGNTVVFADERVSRQHARLQARGGVLVLIDLESSNGTRVNGERITEVVVGAGDVIEIGGASIRILDVDDGEAMPDLSPTSEPSAGYPPDAR